MTWDIPASSLRRFARSRRANAVQAETILWRAIRDRRCSGAKFRRQVPIGNFIVDFVCFEKKLVIEVDGRTHHGAEQEAKDHERDAWLGEQSFTILRLSNELESGAPSRLQSSGFAPR